MNADSTIQITIIHPFTLSEAKIGGVETFIKDFVRMAPDFFDIRLIGITADRATHLPGEWYNEKIGPKSCSFFPVLYVPDPNKRTRFPLSLKFVLGLFRYRKTLQPILNNSIVDFHRIESGLPFIRSPFHRVAFLHVDRKDLLHPDSETKWKQFRLLHSLVEKPILHSMDRIVSVTNKGVEIYRKRYPKLGDRISFMPTWVDNAIFHLLSPEQTRREREILGKELGLDKRDIAILFAGRFEGQKNPELLLESFALALRKRPELVLLLAGRGSLESRMRGLAGELGIESRVHFLGQRSREYLARLANISSLFLMTSSFEGMPIALLEAMACGLPAVTTIVGETGLIVRDGKNGRLVADAGKEAIGEAIIEVLSSPKLYGREKVAASIQPYYIDAALAPLYQMHRELSHE